MLIPNLMAVRGGFPVIAAVNNGTDTAAAMTTDVQLPAGIISGDKLLIFGAADNANWGTNPVADGWTVIVNGGGALLHKNASGAEGAAVTVTWGSDRQTRWYSVRINGASTAAPEAVGTATGSSTAPNPPALTPTWAQMNTLWFTFVHGTSLTFSAYPANFSYSQYAANATPGIQVASRQLNAASEDPGAATTNNAAWRAWTVAVRPR